MAWDDPVVWILIVGMVVFLFGANKIPQIAKGLGEARREFENASKGIVGASPTVAIASPAAVDPLIDAAHKEGIDTAGKTREQIASEISVKLGNS